MRRGLREVAMVSARRHRWRTFCLCVGGAVVFWLLNALNKVYTTEINYPVSFIVDESEGSFAKRPPSTLRIEVTGGGWKLLKYVFRLNAQPVQLSVSQVSRGGRIRKDRLCAVFSKRFKDVEVHGVLLDEALYTHKPSQK
jgi:hypothetical protein